MKIGLGFLGTGMSDGKTFGFAVTHISTLLKTFLFSILFLFSFLSFGGSAEAAITPGDPNNFITVWDTSKPGVSNNKQITIPGTGSGYNYDIYWEDTASSSINGTILGVTTNTKTITFPATGVYRVEIAGSFPRIYFDFKDDKYKIRYINQWGNIQWQSMERAFSGTIYLLDMATDTPDLSNVTSMFNMSFFSSFTSSNIDNWDVSNVTNMKQMFYSSPSNNSLNNWDVSNVADMSHMFSSAFFNQPLNSWNTSNVTTMSSMFSNATVFNQPLNNWNTSKVTNFSSMFFGASVFNQPLNFWDTSKVTNFSAMFWNASTFDQDLSSWDISSVTNMSGMFYNVSLSQVNQDATLVSWADQAVNKNITGIPLHIGVANYSATGSAAIQTLRGLGWTIDEQHSVKYKVQAPATISGTTYQIVASGTNASAITVTYNSDICTFLGWSDGRKDNPRQDLNVTTNIEVEALLSCSSRPTIINQTISSEVSLTVSNSVTLSPGIPGFSGGVSDGGLLINIKTNNPSGYSATLSFAEAVPFRHTFSPALAFINNYIPVNPSVPDYNFITPSEGHGFAFSIFSESNSEVPIKFRNNGSSCGVGTLVTTGKCWFNQSDATEAVTILKRSTLTPSIGSTSTIAFRIGVDQNPVPALLSGPYHATATITVLAE